jgi:peptide/nickel transport system substrate-binding protein
MLDHSGLTRRAAMRLFAAGGATLLAACGPSAPPAPGGTQAPAQLKPTAATTAPTAPVSTQPAPAPTQALPAPTQPARAPSGAAAGETPKRGGELQMMFNLSITNFDPTQVGSYSAVASSFVYEGLTEVQPDGSIAPALAESWTVSPDGLVYAFKIRKGIKFHNGREMSADDVLYTFSRIKDPATNYPRPKQWAVLTEITAPDPGTVVMRLEAPYSPLLTILADITVSIIPKEAAATISDLPVGTGPFKFVEQVNGDHTTFAANKDYWRAGRPYLDGIRLVIRTDDSSRVLALQSGQGDWIYDAAGASYDILSKDQNFNIYGSSSQGSQGTYAYMLLNGANHPPFQDQRVRQAIYWALDRPTITNLSLPGLAAPTQGPYAADYWAGLKDVVYTPDPARAKQLLADAGYAEGFKFTMHTGAVIEHFVRATQTIQQELKPLGIDVQIEVHPATQPFAPFINAGQWEAVLFGTPGAIDPDIQLQPFSFGQNLAVKYSDAQIDQYLKQAQLTADQPSRAKLYQEAQRRLVEVGPWAFLYMYNKYDIGWKYVKGYVYNPVNYFQRPQMRDVWLDK